MTHSHQLTDAAQVLKFVLAGNARFTLVSTNTGKRFTYRVRAKTDEGAEAPSIWFVSVLTGSDNESDYTYLGHIFRDRRYQHGRKSKIGADATSAVVFDFFWQRLAFFAIPLLHTKMEFWHEGACGACGRTLTVPESIASGFGPECAKRFS